MARVKLGDGRSLDLTKVSDIQLKTRTNLGPGTAPNPLIVEVVEIDGLPIKPTKLVVGDTYGIWAKHQTDAYLERSPLSQALSPGERHEARVLFSRLLAAEAPVAASVDAPRPRDRPRNPIWPWVGNHLVQVILSVIATVVGSLIVIWVTTR